MSVGTLSAVNSESNAQVFYQFTEGSNLFKIDRLTGEIFRIKGQFDNHHQLLVHRITVQACYNELMQHCSSAKIYLKRNNNSTMINLPIPIDLKNKTVIYRAKENGLIDLDGFGFCNHTSIIYQNQSLIFMGENQIKLDDQINCQFWSLFELQKFTNLKIKGKKKIYSKS